MRKETDPLLPGDAPRCPSCRTLFHSALLQDRALVQN